jgi:hypothetical protein
MVSILRNNILNGIENNNLDLSAIKYTYSLYDVNITYDPNYNKYDFKILIQDTGALGWDETVYVSQFITTVNGEGKPVISELDMTAFKTGWFFDSGTKVSLTQYCDGEQTRSIVNEQNGNWWSKCGDLADFATGVLDGSIQFNDNTRLECGVETVAEDNPEGIPAGDYDVTRAVVQGQDGTTAAEVTTMEPVKEIETPEEPAAVEADQTDEQPAEQTPTSYHSVTVSTDRKTGDDLLNLEDSEDGSFEVNAHTEKTFTVTEGEGQEAEMVASGSLEGESYVDTTGTVQAENLTGSRTDVATGTVTPETSYFKLPSYLDARLMDLSTLGRGDCIAVRGTGVIGEYNGESLDDFYVFKESHWYWLGGKEYTIVNPTTGTEVSAGAWIGTPVIESESGEDRLRIETNEQNGVVSTTLQVSQKDAFGNVNPVQDTMVTMNTNEGTTTADSVQVLRDEHGDLTGQLRQNSTSTALNGEQTITDLTANYNGDGSEYDEAAFQQPENLTDIKGFTAKTNPKGGIVSFEEISGSMLNCEYNGDGSLTAYTPEDYASTSYRVPPDAEVSLTDIVGPDGKVLPALSNVLKEGNTTTLDGGRVYAAHSVKDLTDIPESALDGISAEDFTSTTSSIDIVAGVNRKVTSPEGVLLSDEEVYSATRNNKTVYSTDGENFDSETAGEGTVASQTTTDVLRSKVVSTVLENGHPVLDGDNNPVTETITQTPHSIINTNFYGAQETSKGDEEHKSVTSKSVTTAFSQTTVRSDYPDIVLELENYSSESVTYSDGSTVTDSRADKQETLSVQEGKAPELNIEENITEHGEYNADGSGYTDRHVEKGTTRGFAIVNDTNGENPEGPTDKYAGPVLKEATDIDTHTEVASDGSKEVTTTIAAQVATDPNNGLKTYSSDLESVKRFDPEGKLRFSHEDTGVYYVVDEENNLCIRNGRDINDEEYEYTDGLNSPTTV